MNVERGICTFIGLLLSTRRESIELILIYARTAEAWWVNNLVRNPIFVPYTLGKRRLDRIYLDTTFALRSDIYRTFPSKAEGIQELLEKLQAYPEDTTFYLRAWTFGYEDVWLALSAALGTQVFTNRMKSSEAHR